MNKRTTEILVGLFVLLGAAALLFLALKAANLASFTTSGDTYVVQARFDNGVRRYHQIAQARASTVRKFSSSQSDRDVGSSPRPTNTARKPSNKPRA